MKRSFALVLFPFMSLAANYTAEKTVVDSVEVIRLADASRRIEVLVWPAFGNNAVSMKINGQEILWSPYRTLAELKAKGFDGFLSLEYEGEPKDPVPAIRECLRVIRLAAKGIEGKA